MTDLTVGTSYFHPISSIVVSGSWTGFFLFCTGAPTNNSSQFSVLKKFLCGDKLMNDNKYEIGISDLEKFHYQLLFKSRLLISTAKWHLHFSHFLTYFLTCAASLVFSYEHILWCIRYLKDWLAYQRKLCHIVPILIRLMYLKFFNYFSFMIVFFTWFFFKYYILLKPGLCVHRYIPSLSYLVISPPLVVYRCNFTVTV